MVNLLTEELKSNKMPNYLACRLDDHLLPCPTTSSIGIS